MTVGIPFYSKSDISYLIDSIDSILKQSIRPCKLHLIQDGAVSEEVTKIINDYRKKYPDLIKIIILNKKGLPHALNNSISQADTKYYARMDSDDIAFKNRIEKQIDFLEKNNDIDILGAWSIEFESDYKSEKCFINKRPNKQSDIEKYFHYMNPLIHPLVIFRMSVFEKIGFYDERFVTDQDLQLWARALKKKVGISNLQEPLLYFRTEGRHNRRSKFTAILRQILARYSYNTISLRLNILKIVAIIFRLTPNYFKDWAYKKLRG